MPFRRSVLVALVVSLSATAAVSAQTSDGGPDPAAVRVRIGPLWMNPSVSMPNMGIDTNVFNDPSAATPRRDFTITVSPKTDLWLRLGRTWLSGTIAEDIVWYQKYVSERSSNTAYVVAWKAPLNRLVVATSARWIDTRSRPGFEIDARAQRKEPSYAASVEVRGFAKTFIGVRGTSRRVEFSEASVFQGTSLKTELDRTETSAAITIRHELTPLTSLTFSAGRSEQAFKFSPRDATSNDYTLSVSFDPAALLKGTATFGYTAFDPAAADLPAYNGTTASVNLSYMLLGSTRFAGTVSRNIEFSYDIDQPYYVQTGVTGSIAQQLFGPVDVVGRFGSQSLEYRNRTGAEGIVADRTDRLRSYGGGIGYHLGEDLRLGFNIDKERRRSVISDREHEGLKYGTSLTYGL
jgi:hypothetical protein